MYVNTVVHKFVLRYIDLYGIGHKRFPFDKNDSEIHITWKGKLRLRGAG